MQLNIKISTCKKCAACGDKCEFRRIKAKHGFTANLHWASNYQLKATDALHMHDRRQPRIEQGRALPFKATSSDVEILDIQYATDPGIPTS